MVILFLDKRSTPNAILKTKLSRSSIPIVWLFCHLLLLTIGAAPTFAQDVESFSTGLIPATPDDVRGVPRPPTYRAFLDERVDLSDLFPVPGDQGSQGSCTAWAVGYAARAYWTHTLEERDVRSNANIPSPTYIFNKARDGKCENGASIGTTLEVLKDAGSLSLRQLPYDANYCNRIPQRLEAEVSDFRISGWSYIEPARSDVFLDNVKGAISNRQPVIIGIRLFFPNGVNVRGPFQNLKAGQIYNNSDAPAAFTADFYHSFHAMTVVGYDDRKQAFKVINSWSTKWADRGFGWIDYVTFENNVNEAWVMQVARQTPFPFPSPPKAPLISLFSSNPVSIVKGGKATLSWLVSRTSSVRIDNGVGSVGGNSIELAPIATTEYTLTAENAGGIATAKATVEVTEPPPPLARPVINSFSSNPSNIINGQSAILSWSVSEAASLRLDNGVGAVTGNSIVVSPAATTDYILTAENGAGTATATAKVTVSPKTAAAPTCTLSVAPSPMVRGRTATLTYVSQNTNDGRIDNGVGNVPPSGTKSISPVKTTTYTGTFSGAGGTATCIATVTVNEPLVPLPVIASFNAGPSSIRKGQSSILSWSVSGATSVRIDNGVGDASGDNSASVSPETTTTYKLTAESSAGSVTDATTVTILPPEEIVLPKVECGKIAINRLGGKAVVDGFVGYDRDFDAIRASAPGAEVDVKVRPWPQCEALQTLENALSHADRPKVSIRRSVGDTLTAGDPVIFDIQTTSYPSYVHVAYIQADGSVINLIQPGDGSLRTYAPNSKIVIGDNVSGRHFFVQEPFGREMLIVLSARSPIFPDRRPRQETEREFLTALRRALIAKPDPNAPERDIVASFDAIVTKDK
jgi:hypothetical protein